MGGFIAAGKQGAAGRSKRDSSTACPGASRNTKGAGHSARNDMQVRGRQFRATRETLRQQASPARIKLNADTD